MAPRGRRVSPEVRLLVHRLLAHQEDELGLVELSEAAAFLGARLTQFDPDPRKPRDEALPPAEHGPTAERLRKKYEDELLEINATRLGLRLFER